MKLILISSPTAIDNEKETLRSLFANGLELFHLRKPDFTWEEMEEYLKQIPSEHLNKIVIHSHHQLVEKYPLRGKHASAEISNIKKGEYISTSFHSLNEIENCKINYEYAFLSPIFDSISKDDYKSNFSLEELKSFLQKRKILPFGENLGGALIALGGIDEHNLQEVIELGFDGVAVLGAVWRNENPLEAFNKLLKVSVYEL